MKNSEITQRIINKGIHSEDIKHDGRLTYDQICSIPIEKVYVWVRTGEWKQKDFIKWLVARGSV
jgi:hypothetical protein